MGKVKHGMAGTRLYRCWRAMIDRCSNVNIRNYSYYGARGITFVKEWQNFENFQSWAMSNGYNESLTLDRIDVNGNYNSENCRWVSNIIQKRNTRYQTKEDVGVRFKCNKWLAHISVNDKNIHLGSFDEKLLAIKARKEAEEKYWNTII